MKKIALGALAVALLLFTACAAKTTEFTVKEDFLEALEDYNFAEVAESFIENEDGSITYVVAESAVTTMLEDAEKRLAANIEQFVASIKEQSSDIVIDVAFSENATVLEGTVTDAFGAANGMFFLILPSYPDILLTQILAGLDPAGVTLKMTDAVTEEFFEQEIPF